MVNKHKFSIIQGRAVTDASLDDKLFRLLSVYGMFANGGVCFPSQKVVADYLGKSRKWVNEKTQVLEELGYIVKKHDFRDDGGQTSNIYTLIYDTPVTDVGELLPPPVTSVERVGYTNDPYNDPINTGEDKNTSPLPENLPLEWQIVSGKEVTSLPDQKDAQMKDSANLISFGTGSMQKEVYEISLAFMKARNIVLNVDDAKGQRKAARMMVKAGVKPQHIQEAVKYASKKQLMCVDLFSVAKIATNLANPMPHKKQPKKYAAAEEEDYVE